MDSFYGIYGIFETMTVIMNSIEKICMKILHLCPT